MHHEAPEIVESVATTAPPSPCCPACQSWHTAAHTIKEGYRVCLSCRSVFKPQPRPEAAPPVERRHKPPRRRPEATPRKCDSVLGYLEARGVKVPESGGYSVPDREGDE